MNVNGTPLLLPLKPISAAEVEKIVKSMGRRVDNSNITVGEDGSVAITSKSDEEDTKAWLETLDQHGTYAYIQAGDAISSMTRQISTVQSAVEAERPSLSGKKWDFTLTDGKFVVSGNGLTKDDTDFIENKLKGNEKLVHAAQSLIGAAVKSLQRTDDLQGGTTNTLYSAGTRSLVFDNVAEQLNGAIDFKQFLSRNEDLATYHGHNQIDDTFRGFSAIEILGSKLDSNVKAVGYSVFPTAR